MPTANVRPRPISLLSEVAGRPRFARTGHRCPAPKCFQKKTIGPPSGTRIPDSPVRLRQPNLLPPPSSNSSLADQTQALSTLFLEVAQKTKPGRVPGRLSRGDTRRAQGAKTPPRAARRFAAKSGNTRYAASPSRRSYWGAESGRQYIFPCLLRNSNKKTKTWPSESGASRGFQAGPEKTEPANSRFIFFPFAKVSMVNRGTPRKEDLWDVFGTTVRSLGSSPGQTPRPQKTSHFFAPLLKIWFPEL